MQKRAKEPNILIDFDVANLDDVRAVSQGTTPFPVFLMLKTLKQVY